MQLTKEHQPMWDEAKMTESQGEIYESTVFGDFNTAMPQNGLMQQVGRKSEMTYLKWTSPNNNQFDLTSIGYFIQKQHNPHSSQAHTSIHPDRSHSGP